MIPRSGSRSQPLVVSLNRALLRRGSLASTVFVGVVGCVCLAWALLASWSSDRTTAWSSGAPDSVNGTNRVEIHVDGPDTDDVKTTELHLAARKGLLPWGSLGPRPPKNDRERKLARIPEYHAETDLVFYSHIHKTSGTSLSVMLAQMFPRSAVVPTSHPYRGLEVDQLVNHHEGWWDPYQVMFSHNRPNVTDEIGIPDTKHVRLLLTVRNPLLHKASIYFESVCRFGLHIKDGVIDQEEATRARMASTLGDTFSFCRDPELWVGSTQFHTVYRNFESTWLSYGGAERHQCIAPNLEVNLWKASGDGAAKCKSLEDKGESEAIWEEFFERSADAAVRRLEGALWVGVTERMAEASCLLFFTLGKKKQEMGTHRLKAPRPITMWNEASIAKAGRYDKADWRVFEAANNILDLRLWTARQMLKDASEEERSRLGSCFEVLSQE